MIRVHAQRASSLSAFDPLVAAATTPLPRDTWKWCLRVADSAPPRLSAGCARAGDNAALR
jgi:hypothetical protein